eukprot:Blabericola_migrator_1__8318@NODE_431_length_8568_cov_132_476179_g339_i1_p2_GENE_NODE_431_length_8568_cov_132_476179_g339_i1NODE_431_length_8568_cov_132_476179_g339_i1_p2_ORF_typecomplete_len551_score92_40Thioredoxin/PF00085_20/2_2e10Thioredoxin/PF00085_20/9_7e09Thioredoxin_2/PF13098_6/3_3e07Thioredoxin_2/PF13098_6/22AhpCTSA/PF00578_21/0_00012AhpCTSA/PF00578_21/2_1e03AhpCTSA/PF00578_21/0_1Thioredoxin_7/PF13899_6/5_9e05Thioredoxin_7/PF13899_6/4_7e03Thioredoxin_7/PF13899_6/0_96Thioredoxin_8/PF1390
MSLKTLLSWLVVCESLGSPESWKIDLDADILGFAKAQVFANASPFVDEEDLILLSTRDVIDKALKEGRPLLTTFTADWCGQCRKYYAELQKLELLLRDQSLKLPWINTTFTQGVLEIQNDSDLIRDWGIDWVPTTLLFKPDGDLADYPGPWRAANLLLWLHQQFTGKSSFYVEDIEVMTMLMEFMSELSVLCGCQDVERLVSEWPRDLPPVSASKVVCSAVYDAPPQGCTVRYRLSKSQPFVIIPIDESHTIQWEFLSTLMTPVRLSRSNHVEVFSSEYPLLLAVYPEFPKDEETINNKATLKNQDKLNKQVHQKAIEVMNNIRHVGKVTCAEMGTETPFERRLLDYMGISTLWDRDKEVAMSFKLDPMLLLLKPTKAFLPKYAIANAAHLARMDSLDRPQLIDAHHHWMYDGSSGPWWTADEESLTQWLSRALQGTTPPTILKSEAVDYRPDGAITYISSNGLSKLLASNETNLVLYVRASWCGHCLKVDPVFKKVAEKFATGRILFAAMNSDLNDLPLFKTQDNEGGGWEYRALLHEGPPLILLFPSQ